MYKLSTLISSKIISLIEGENLGIITNIIFDQKLKANFLIAGNDENTYLIDLKQIVAINDAIIIKSKNDIMLKNELADIVNIINKECYNFEGKILGVVNDIIINENFNIEDILISGKNFKKSDIALVGADLILINDSEKKVSINRLKSNYTKKTKTAANIKVSDKKIISSKKQIINLDIKKDASNINKKLFTNRISGNVNFLINRKLTKNIISENNILIARKDSSITKKVIEESQKYFKLNDLIKFSK